MRYAARPFPGASHHEELVVNNGQTASLPGGEVGERGGS